MSDERLRALQRAARADPSDHATGRALAHALLQAGDRRRALFEYSRLARAGDLDARAVVRGWSTRAHVWQANHRARARPLAGPARRREWRSRTPPYTTPLLVGSDERVVMFEVGYVRAFDDELATCWQHDVQLAARAAMCGDDVLHSDGRGVVLRDARSGVQLMRSELNVTTITGLLVDGDRAFVLHLDGGAGRHHVTALDVGQRFGHVLWSRSLTAMLWLGGRHLVAVEADRIELWRPGSGHEEASRRILPRGRGQRAEVVTSVDDRGVLTMESNRSSAPDEGASSINEYALPSLEPRWRLDRRSHVHATLLGDVALVCASRSSGSPRPATLLAVDRTSGEVVGERELDEPVHQVFGRAGSAIYAVVGAAAPRLLALDARTLEDRERYDLGVEGLDHVFDLLVVDGGVVVVFEMMRPVPGTVIVRLGSEG